MTITYSVNRKDGAVVGYELKEDGVVFDTAFKNENNRFVVSTGESFRTMKALKEHFTANPPAVGAAPPAPGSVGSRKLRVGDDGRLVIPADMRSAMLIDDTGSLTARVVDGELRVLAPDAALFKLQGMMRERVPEGVSAVDELIAERRTEARREDAE